MKLLYGLGNPDTENENNRHNVGWMILDNYRKSLVGASPWEIDASCEILTSETSDDGKRVILCKPTRYMNDQGICLVGATIKYGLNISKDVLVLHGDLDLPFGKIRLRPRGSPPSHNGLMSVREAIGSDLFWRLRVGIESRIDRKSVSGEEFVLSDFTAEELETLNSLLGKAVAIIRLWVADQCQKAIQLST